MAAAHIGYVGATNTIGKSDELSVMPRLPRLIKSASGWKPKVMLVDDHRGVLDRVSALLAEDFEIAGVASDGAQAIHMAADIAPDAIVLDVNMPGLDGFQTKRGLEQAGSRAPVVFLSAAGGDEYISEAFRCGARGYVTKARVARDLASALDQVLFGRLFSPSLTSLFEVAASGGHALQVHGDLDGFLDGVAAFFDEALRRGDATCIIATPDVRVGLERRLATVGWEGNKRLLIIDAADAIRRFMRDGLPDSRILAEIASELDQYRRDAGEGVSPRLTIFGNMAGLLIEEGHPKAAIALESKWNTLTHGRPFLTLCGYSNDCLHGVPGLWSGTCQQHRIVSHTNDI